MVDIFPSHDCIILIENKYLQYSNSLQTQIWFKQIEIRGGECHEYKVAIPYNTNIDFFVYENTDISNIFTNYLAREKMTEIEIDQQYHRNHFLSKNFID